MVKILSRSGDSLADLYDVKGSIAGIDELDSRELSIFHEMGSTVFSERLSSTIRRTFVASVAQTANFDVVLTDLPAGIWRVLGAIMFASVAGRVDHAMLAMRNPAAGREFPFVTWDIANDVESEIRIDESGAGGIGAFFQLVANPLFATLGVGTGQRTQTNEIAFRGTTSAFGAGTVDVMAVIQIAFTHVGGISSRGLPVPSW